MSAPPGAGTAFAADLVRMANQIAAQFDHLTVADAAEAVAAHLEAFWTPAMRAELSAALDAAAPVVRLALRRLGAGLDI